MISIDEALELVLTRAGAAGPRAGAAGRRGRAAWPPSRRVSAVDLPPFDRSAMDGYAVRAADTAPGRGAAAGRRRGGRRGGRPRRSSPAPPRASRPARRSRRAPTRSCSPSWRSSATGPSRPSARSRPARTSATAARTCTRATSSPPPARALTLPRISALASAGVGEVAVHRRPRLHLIVTGSELLPLGAPPEPGRIHESNGLMVRLLAARAGAEVVDHGVDRRRPRGHARRRVGPGWQGDVLVVSGGVSVGPHDHVKPAFESCGVEEVFWRVRIKPGKPLWFGRRGDTLVFGLPGNPLSTIVCFCVFIEPALRRLAGEPDARPRLEPRPPDDRGARVRRPHHVPHGDAAPGRRRRARGDPDRAPGLAHDRRARRERRLRRRARGGRRAAGRRAGRRAAPRARRGPLLGVGSNRARSRGAQ